MKKYRSALIWLLAFNAVTFTYSASNVNRDASENLYNQMTRNIETGKSNDSNYKQIEKILNKKNKEIKDLYLQGDYIVKPEYLEWQIFFSGFYAERRKVDNTLNNALYPATRTIRSLCFSGCFWASIRVSLDTILYCT